MKPVTMSEVQTQDQMQTGLNNIIIHFQIAQSRLKIIVLCFCHLIKKLCVKSA